MFDRIAPRYDLLNRVLSLGNDVRWRRRVVDRVSRIRPDRVLDVCTGTADLALAMPGGPAVFGCDFSISMLAMANAKAARLHRPLRLFAADALQLPLQSASVDVLTVAFGIRNFEDLGSGLRELARVLRPDGVLLALEFSHPRGLLAPVLGWWVRNVPPKIGRLVSRDQDAYDYLSASVARFANETGVREVLDRSGFRTVTTHRLTGGVATVYQAIRCRSITDHEKEER
jgi:demethylmenaquinone methyltransferase/2-methoxy-6-polyprenyl-1,4-benzoquinol methylase